MNNTEINELVARKLGNTVKCGCDCLAPTNQPDNEWTHPLHYSTNIQAAWEIVEKIRETRGIELRVGIVNGNGLSLQKWACQIFRGPYELADTAPMALCLAFLKLP